MELWKKRAIDDLMLLEVRRQAAEGVRIRIRQLEADAVSLSAVSYSTIPTRGGGNRQEQRLCAMMAKKERLERERDNLISIVEYTEACLARLPDRERAVLSAFYLNRLSRGEAVRKLERELYVSEATVYRIRERALTTLAMMMGYI